MNKLKISIPIAICVLAIVWSVVLFLKHADITNELQSDLIGYVGTLIAAGIGAAPPIMEWIEKKKNTPTFSKFLKKHSIGNRTSSNPFDYRNPDIGLYGREEESTRIKKFLHCEGKRKLWAIAGCGGMGKSKLAFHIAKECKQIKWYMFRQKKWHVFWLTETTIEELLKCEIDTKGRHLFICDYAGRYTKYIAELLKKLHEKNVHFRMLLLERASYGSSFTDTESWFAKLRRCETAEELFSSYDLEYCEDPFSPAPLNLAHHPLSEENYSDILDAFAKALKKTLTLDQKKEIIDFVCNGMKAETDVQRAENNRCLFLLFTAHAVMHGDKLNMMDRAGVFQSYITKKEQSHFPPELKGHEQTSLLLLALATAGGAFDLYDTQMGKCEEWCAELREILPDKRSAIAGVLSVLCERSDADTTTVTPLLPDLLGEFLVMYVYKEYKPKEFFPLLFTNSRRDHFEDFLTRLWSDWGEDERAKKFIADVKKWIMANGEHADKILLAQVYHNVGMIYADRADYHRAEDYYKKAVAIEKTECGEDSIGAATAYNNFGIIYVKMGNCDKAMDYFRKALKITEKKLGTNHPSTASTYLNIGTAYQKYGKNGYHDKALNYYLKALSIYEQNPAYKNYPDTASAYNNIGLLYQDLGRYDEALNYYYKVLDICEQNPAYENCPNTAGTYNNIGLLYHNLGRYDEALNYYCKALNIYEQNPAYENHPDIASVYSNIGWANDDLGKYDKALHYYQKAQNVFEAVYGTNHPSSANIYNNIGITYKNLHRYDEALKYYQKARKVKEAVYGIKHPSTANTYLNTGSVYGHLNKHDKELHYYQKALKVYESVHGSNHPSTANAYNNIGTVHKALKNYTQALKYYTKAHSIYQSKLGDNNPRTECALRNINIVESLLNNPKE